MTDLLLWQQAHNITVTNAFGHITCISIS